MPKPMISTDDSLVLKEELILWLGSQAKRASKNSYSPYSKFPVGAAVLTHSSTFLGCNVENASYGLTNCAERTAIFRMIAEGERKILAVAIYTPTKVATPPCGACRQVINEFGSDIPIFSFVDAHDDLGLHYTGWSIAELLPGAFGPKNLGVLGG